MNDEWLADAAPLAPFVYPDFTQELDATIIAAPSSTKNATGTRDPAMHQTQKGQQWYFGMKGHFGVDSQSKLIHSVEVTPANIHDAHVLPWLLHGEERRVWGDSAYTGQAAVLSV